MNEKGTPGTAPMHGYDDETLGEVLDRIVGGSAGYFTGTAPAATAAVVERIRDLAERWGIELTITLEGELTVVRVRSDVDLGLPGDLPYAA